MSELSGSQSAPTQTPSPQADEHRHVYLSYPSSDKHVAYMIQLYDVLRHHGFEVHLAQYVQGEGLDRPPRHVDDLSQSDAAILIWSKDDKHAKWSELEYKALLERCSAEANFPIVVIQIELGDPVGVENQFRLNSSSQSEGPYGSILHEIFNLLLRRSPSPVPALAKKLDQETQQVLQAIKASNTKADHLALVSAAKGDSSAWSTSPLLGTLAAHELIKAQAYDEALEILNSVGQRFPTTIRYRQLQGLAYRRIGDLEQAHLVLDQLYDQGERDPETLGISAAAWMDLYSLSRDREHLNRSRDRYADAFKTQPANYYVGLNAATKSMLLGEEQQAITYADAVEPIIGSEEDYWSQASRAEIQLLRRQFKDAAELYKKAVAAESQSFDSHESTWLQAQRLLAYFQNDSHRKLTPEEARNAFEMIAAAFPNFGPALAFTQEVRLAVVMYGGVSLAIYINGVAQELLNLVRATAPADLGKGENSLAEAKLTSTEKVYRKLGQILGRSAQAGSQRANGPAEPNEPIRTAFVVDIISGTSAGGINGMFLAKSLARNMRMNGLKKMWIDDADISQLINDKKTSGAPKSLLDSKYMYGKLLEALEVMENPDEPPPKVNAVDELDLYITTTDIHGLAIPIALADQKIYERRHKNVFHFKHLANDARHQDFSSENSPFLAFAARCTSAFPFAFEPMKLSDVVKKPMETWKRFYADYEMVEEDQPRLAVEVLAMADIWITSRSATP